MPTVLNGALLDGTLKPSRVYLLVGATRQTVTDVRVTVYPTPAAKGRAPSPDELIELVEKPLIERTLEKTGGNQLQAAALLGINRNTLRKKITLLDIDPHAGSSTDKG